MALDYCILVDWQKEYDNWIYSGADIMHQKSLEKLTLCRHGNNYKAHCDKCHVYPDDTAAANMPMLNYAYPLYNEPSVEQIVRICEKTNCTVVEKVDTGEYFLALKAGGMDYSQDIGLAYLCAGERIPPALAREISTQYGLSVTGRKWEELMEACESSLQKEIQNSTRKIQSIREALAEMILRAQPR